MPTSTRQILCEFIRADVGIRPYDADFNTSLNYNLKNQIWALCLQIIIKPTSVIAENYNLSTQQNFPLLLWETIDKLHKNVNTNVVKLPLYM